MLPLRVEVTVSEHEGTLRLVVADDGAGLSDRESMADGIGLGNTRARLAGLFGHGASLTLEPGDGARGVRVTITIPPERKGGGG
jgi:LytS/YehU family sensor histidine kinase